MIESGTAKASGSIEESILARFKREKLDKKSVFSPLDTLDDQHLILIRKNDNIKRKINHVLRILASSDEFLLIGHSSGIQKLLAILEIVKQKIGAFEKALIGDEQEVDLLQYKRYVQYNRLESIEWEKHSKEPLQEDSSVDGKSNRIADDLLFSVDQLKELGIVKPKVHKVPILFVYVKMVKSDQDDGERSFERGWTVQRAN